ncbi:DNA-protecting protein DprA [candidate division WWE3 bacterium]|uniref:DNA-protecting protein DprA n=1 Tax=candidate division WWE3 bacterium TaxID=2053526 RepID=A0A7X9DJV0_UNCKA|nr:DNA-protecting protein DprA [candidate division WWE3 bacterium]
MQIPKNDPLYPLLLKTIPDPPEALNYLGNIGEKTFANCIGIVGTRNITPYGTNVVSRFVSDLSAYDCTLVSGLTRGVDTSVHEMCLKKSVKTVAILPFGLNYKVSIDTRRLINEITQNEGVVMSEYPDSFEPKKWSFVRRNRLIAGMSKAILIVEAAEGSGSLLTADFAQKYKRFVYVVPGNIFSPYSTGIYKLLFSYAKAVVSGHSLAKDLALPKNIDLYMRKNADFSEDSARILDALRIAPMSVTDLATYLKVPLVTLSKTLMTLLSGDLVFLKEGTYYAKEN